MEEVRIQWVAGKDRKKVKREGKESRIDRGQARFLKYEQISLAESHAVIVPERMKQQAEAAASQHDKDLIL